MTIQTCDLCGTTMDYKTKLVVRQGWETSELCVLCAKPILRFLAKHNFARKEDESLQTETKRV